LGFDIFMVMLARCRCLIRRPQQPRTRYQLARWFN
jgi:hypothetical protein